MAKVELGTKRICPETGRKFYDLNKDPVVSPYTGIAYPRSLFEAPAAKGRSPAKPAVVPEPEAVPEEKAEVATISLEEADEEAAESGAVKIEGGEVEEIDDEDEADDTFLPAEEEDDEGDVEDIVGDVGEEEA